MISDDELLLYHYRELDAPERARIGAALAADPGLARRLHALVVRLDAAAAIPEVPVPEPVRQRWQAALDRAATNPKPRATPRARTSLGDPAWIAAAAAVVLVALITVLQFMQPRPVPMAGGPVPESTSGAGESAYAHGLKFHLASTERRLARLGEASPEERQRLVETIIGQNQMYALAAERAGEPQLARVLRAFNPILEDLAAGRGANADADIAQLSFEMRVMQKRLGTGAGSTNTL
ncbi:MAG TPA: hypothetical protein VFP37_17120 [Steroidobacteraceae bacterium]|nr:hypothetical protein [Steroidobacteraceae bacterium]